MPKITTWKNYLLSSWKCRFGMGGGALCV